MNMKETLHALTELPAPPGFEGLVKSYIESRLQEAGIRDLFTDNLGNLCARISGTEESAPVLHLDAHMDEPCFIVRYIDEGGHVFVAPLGYMADNLLMGQRVSILTKTGIFKGGFGVNSFHSSGAGEKGSIVSQEDLWIDIGARNREAALESGVKPGMPVVFDEPFIELLSGNVMAKAFDDRVGCAVVLKALERLVQHPPRSTVLASFTVQEELILRGSNTVYNGFRKFFHTTADVCLVYDICSCGDVPHARRQKAPLDLGRGPAIKLYDKSAVSHFAHVVPWQVVEYLEVGCAALSLPYQYDLLSGCTNADQFTLDGIGVLTGGISIPCRYTHSAVEIVNLSDAEQAVELTCYAAEHLWEHFTRSF